MSAERQWPDFEWSPEAIGAAGKVLREGHPHFVHSDGSAREVLKAAVKAQPVVALPPTDEHCLSCEQSHGNPLPLPPVHVERQRCPASKRVCGHHCNHSWSHDHCDWCGETWGEQGPVVTLPPCPKCNGSGRYRDPRYWGTMPGSTPCLACNGSGVERMVPEAALRAWIEEQRTTIWRVGPIYQRAMDDLSAFLDSLHLTGGDR